jgi:energy-coupling factor transport system substrate-specific component
MSATAASILILTVGLVASFAWWERSRPPARLLALVATVAALAALGRIAFAPIPNVKPTTDIVLFAGFALGAAPGFAVGAIAALTSNFFFGQGPWTPWQMAAWGLVGLLGAGLARIAPRSGRVRLSLACAFAGLLYGELLNASLWVTYSDHSVTALLGYIGRGVPFDVAHVVGNVAFCLAFGPAFVAALSRFQLRMHVRWIPVAAVLPLLALAPLALATPTTKPVRYLAGAQNADGGFGAAPGQRTSSLYTGWAALGLEAVGRHPADVANGGASLLDYLQSAPQPDTGARARTILALAPAGADVGALVADLRKARGHNGAYDGRVNTTAFAVLALKAAVRGKVTRSATWLATQQNADGGFNFAGKGGQSGIDDTSAPLQALVAAGGHARTVRRAARFLVAQQQPDGGFPLSPGSAVNAQSTAWAVQGLVAAGHHQGRVRKALGFLRGLTHPSGAVRYSRTSTQTPVWVTAQALAALARKPFPLPAVARAAATPAPTADVTKATPTPSATAKPKPKPAVPPAPQRTSALARLARIVGAFTAVLVRFRAA